MRAVDRPVLPTYPMVSPRFTWFPLRVTISKEVEVAGGEAVLMLDGDEVPCVFGVAGLHDRAVCGCFNGGPERPRDVHSRVEIPKVSEGVDGPAEAGRDVAMDSLQRPQGGGVRQKLLVRC